MTRPTSFLAALALALTLLTGSIADARERWTAEAAEAWYAKQPWLVGANYVPATAINQLDMFQAATWDPKTIDEELGWAQAIGMNTMRVYLHNLLWEQDADGLKRRMREYLDIADKHGMSTMFVLFDSVWNPNPQLGPQHPPIPGVHNSGWVQAPGRARLEDKSQYGKLEAYVKDVVGTFANDRRIVAWDVWNEPSNRGGGNYPDQPNKQKLVAELLDDVFVWARSQDPVQPLTSGVWEHDDWSSMEKLDAIEKIQIGESDIISFHDYNWPETFERRVRQLMTYGRPIIATEYMARGNGSTFDGSLPIGKRYNVGMINWGLVDGETQTKYPWDSWERPYTKLKPSIWFHEVFRADGTPYRAAEAALIKRLTSAPKGIVPPAPATAPSVAR